MKLADAGLIEQRINEILGEPPGAWDDQYRDFIIGNIYWEDTDQLAFIYKEGGGEGGSEHVETIFKLDGKFYKAIYSYQSHEGYDTDYLAMYEVTPTEKVVTVYE